MEWGARSIQVQGEVDDWDGKEGHQALGDARVPNRAHRGKASPRSHGQKAKEIAK